MAEFETSVTLHNTQQAICDFLLNPANIQKISPPETGLRFTNAPDRISEGSQIEFEMRGFGQTQRLIHTISVLDYPSRFVEQQTVGPLKNWVHEHRIVALDQGLVEVTDAIQFTAPGGLIGLLMTESRILDNLRQGFEYRHQKMQELLDIAT